MSEMTGDTMITTRVRIKRDKTVSNFICNKALMSAKERRKRNGLKNGKKAWIKEMII